MAEDFAHFSVLDDPSSLLQFVHWANNLGGGPKLRGGDRTMSESLSEISTTVETPTKPAPIIEQDWATTPATSCDIYAASVRHVPKSGPENSPSNQPFLGDENQHQIRLVVESHATISNFPSRDTIEDFVPIQSPVISIAHRGTSQNIVQSTPGHSSTINKLDYSPEEDIKSMTPTQQRLLQRMGPEERSKQTTNLRSQNESPTKQPIVVEAQPKTDELVGKAIVSYENTDRNAVGLNQMTTTQHFAAPGTNYKTMSFYDQKAEEFFNPPADKSKDLHKAVMLSQDGTCAGTQNHHRTSQRLNAMAANYQPQRDNLGIEHHSRTSQDPDCGETEDARITTGMKYDEDNDAADNIEGGIDLMPVLKALDARSTNPEVADSPAVGTIHVAESSDDAEVEAHESAMTNTEAIPEDIQAEPLKKQCRTVIFHKLPEDSDYTLVQSLVHGAIIENIRILSDQRVAHVKVTDGEDCTSFTSTYTTGLKFRYGRVEHTILVEQSKEPDEFDLRIQAYVECGATRVVRVEDADEDLPMRALYELAEGHNSPREVESIVDLFRKGSRNIDFRFAGIADAVAFRQQLLRDSAWKSKSPQFGEDPCEFATTPRKL